MTIINPDLYWLVGLGLGFIFLGFGLGLFLLHLVALKTPPGGRYSHSFQIYEAIFTEKHSRPHLTFVGMLSSFGAGIVLLVLVLPLVNGLA